jgi:hypothetical protein
MLFFILIGCFFKGCDTNTPISANKRLIFSTLLDKGIDDVTDDIWDFIGVKRGSNDFTDSGMIALLTT